MTETGDEHGRRNHVDVEIGDYGRDFGAQHVIRIIISAGYMHSRRELEWAALTLDEAQDLYDELGDAIKNAKKMAAAA